MPCRFPGPHPRGKFRGIWPGGPPGPHPRGKLRGIWSRPTPKGEVEGDLVQAHTEGEVEGDLAGGVLQGGTCSRGVPPPGGCLLLRVPAPWGVWRPPHDGYCCGRYASYWNAFLFDFTITCIN